MTKRPAGFGKGSGKAKGKGKSKRRDPRKGPSVSSGKRPGKGTKKVAPTAASTADGSNETSKAPAVKTSHVNTGGTAKAAFSVGRAPRPPRPAAAKALALKAERAASAEAAKASAAAALAAESRPVRAPRVAKSLDGSTDSTTGVVAVEPTSTFTLGYIAGATPGRWADIWAEREPLTRLVLLPLSADEQRPSLDAEVDIALVRLPIEGDGNTLHVIPLYDEVPHVVLSIDNELSTLDELTFDDLAGQVVIRPLDDVLGVLDITGAVAPVFEAPASTEEAVATVAAGVGVVIVPQSLARLHRRKDVISRPLVGGPTSSVGLAWHVDRESDDIKTFVGIVRGRKATSSR